MSGGNLTHRASRAVGSLAALSTPLKSNDITSITRHYAAVPGNSEPMQSGPSMYKTEWTISFYRYKLVATVGKYTWQETLTKYLFAGDQASKNFDFYTANFLHISSDLKSNICPNTAPLTLLQLTIRMLRTESFFLDPYNITNLNTLC